MYKNPLDYETNMEGNMEETQSKAIPFPGLAYSQFLAETETVEVQKDYRLTVCIIIFVILGITVCVLLGIKKYYIKKKLESPEPFLRRNVEPQ